MHTTPDFHQLSETAAVFSNVARLRILERLMSGPCIVGDLVQSTGLEQAVISKQLGLLRNAGLLVCQAQGRCREYRLAHPEAVASALTALSALSEAGVANLRDCPKLAVRKTRTGKTSKEVLS
ncbi:metalloregulator ArsR/SmtB family transcription factor [Myxococcota bacterium]|nr:metalloregulator ArsR/SmtB family transcription factor [Myxococcota bacterium]